MTTATAPVPAASPTVSAESDKPIRLVKKHPLAIRWMHWINFPVLFLMIWSGVLILWSYPNYPTKAHAFKVPDRISIYQWGIKPVYGDT